MSRSLADVDPRSADVTSLAAALVNVGCPVDIATDLTVRARIETVGGERVVRLLGHGSAIDDQAGDAALWDEAVEQVAGNIANDNTEGHDRYIRGEAGWPTYWPVRSRPSQRG